MASGTTLNYSFSYPLSTDPVRISQDMEDLATTVDNFLLAPLFKGDVGTVFGHSFKINNNVVLSATELGSGVTSSSLTSVGTITTGTWSATQIAANKGGTGQTSYSTGDILYASSSSALSKLPIGADGHVLSSNGASPTWIQNTGTGNSVRAESPTLTGIPIAPTAAVDTNTTQIATTAFVIGQGYLKSTAASSTYAPLSSPALTGTPTAPTASGGTNTTQIATTEFVQSAVAGVVGQLPSQTGNSGRYLTTNGTTASWDILTFSDVSSTPTTLAGYGITDALNTSSTGQTKNGTLNVVSPTAAGSNGVRNITMSTSTPSGGSDGDVWLVYV
jgi:hypothetical protein